MSRNGTNFFISANSERDDAKRAREMANTRRLVPWACINWSIPYKPADEIWGQANRSTNSNECPRRGRSTATASSVQQRHPMSCNTCSSLQWKASARAEVMVTLSQPSKLKTWSLGQPWAREETPKSVTWDCAGNCSLGPWPWKKNLERCGQWTPSSKRIRSVAAGSAKSSSFLSCWTNLTIADSSSCRILQPRLSLSSI